MTNVENFTQKMIRDLDWKITKEFAAVNERLDSQRKEFDGKFDGINKRFEDLGSKVAGFHAVVANEIALNETLQDRVSAIESKP